ncbi:hypothetical protein FIBSPDRAFT_900253 [Athelia psychrophila]|uniref:Uncharacterized protein n=1 Tax=Athelia psychrophila TaxID=1759441 RepID=A0A165YNH0_9AGAM|nr:hypothetical protein FIBSPDRAFT_900253 [Fibularhizoctonia sp. CBS 109695]
MDNGDEHPIHPSEPPTVPTAFQPSADWSQDITAVAKSVYDQIFAQVYENLIQAFGAEVQRLKDSNVSIGAAYTAVSGAQDVQNCNPSLALTIENDCNGRGWYHRVARNFGWAICGCPRAIPRDSHNWQMLCYLVFGLQRVGDAADDPLGVPGCSGTPGGFENARPRGIASAFGSGESQLGNAHQQTFGLALPRPPAPPPLFTLPSLH